MHGICLYIFECKGVGIEERCGRKMVMMSDLEYVI